MGLSYKVNELPTTLREGEFAVVDGVVYVGNSANEPEQIVTKRGLLGYRELGFNIILAYGTISDLEFSVNDLEIDENDFEITAEGFKINNLLDPNRIGGFPSPDGLAQSDEFNKVYTYYISSNLALNQTDFVVKNESLQSVDIANDFINAIVYFRIYD